MAVVTLYHCSSRVVACGVGRRGESPSAQNFPKCLKFLNILYSPRKPHPNPLKKSLCYGLEQCSLFNYHNKYWYTMTEQDTPLPSFISLYGMSDITYLFKFNMLLLVFDLDSQIIIIHNVYEHLSCYPKP